MVNLKKKKIQLFFLSVVSLTILLDQLTKYLIYKFNPQLDLGLLMIHFIKNTGAGFGILSSQIYLLAFISLVVSLVMILIYPKVPKKYLPQFFYALFLGGVMGNLLDRLFRRFVIDFLDFIYWPTFNLADMAISIAALGLIIYFWRE